MKWNIKEFRSQGMGCDDSSKITEKANNEARNFLDALIEDGILPENIKITSCSNDFNNPCSGLRDLTMMEFIVTIFYLSDKTIL
jgi:hypothetical protein